MNKAKSKIVEVGDKVNMLTVIAQTEDKIEKNGKHRACFLCVCECGKQCVCPASYLNLKKRSKYSCGCTKRYNLRNKNPNAKSKQRLYHIWVGIKTRCYNSNHHSYALYGAKGITMCDDWKTSYDNFHEWSVNNGYSDDLTLDRIDNSKGYSPENCRWASYEEQSLNRTNNHLLTINGETKSISQWSHDYNISSGVILNRLRRGWEDERAVRTPVTHNTKYITVNGETHSQGEWERLLNYGTGTISTRLRRGWSPEQAILIPPIETGYNRETIKKKGSIL